METLAEADSKEEMHGTGVSGYHNAKRSQRGGKAASKKVSPLRGGRGCVKHFADEGTGLLQRILLHKDLQDPETGQGHGGKDAAGKIQEE